jgi:hypothetical protein
MLWQGRPTKQVAGASIGPGFGFSVGGGGSNAPTEEGIK